MEATGKSNHNHRDEGTQQSTSPPHANSDISSDNHSLSSNNGKKRSRAPSAEEIGRHGDCGGDVRCQVDFHDGVGEAEGTEERATEENNAEAIDSSREQGGMMNMETAPVATEAKDEKRRRLSQETQPVTSIDNSATSQPHEETFSKPRNKKIKSLRLEAIFHPKFENESSEKDIRKEMLEKIQNREGHLEVTLKHSGSLLLWSGGSRFYSKNSANNSVTIVGEFLLRQHMARLWNDDSSNNNDSNSCDINKECTKYDECSNYLQTHRLTLAFEVITPFILGDHGSIPKRSFLILLAVADRKRHTFYTTHELISLAHRFRLPHNDYWIFTSHNGAEKVFEFYDDVREIGTADIVVKGLDQLVDQYHYGGHDIGGSNGADSGRRSNTVPVGVVGNDERERTTRRIVSMHPHLEYQGNILEGLVVRFVPRTKMKKSILVDLCDDGVLAGDNSCYDDDFLTSLNDLALNSKTYLNIASTATFTEEKSPSDGAILSKNVLDFFLRDNSEVTEDESSLRTYLISRYKSQQSQRMELTKGIEAKADWNISSWMQDLKKSGELDNETKKIVELIDTLAEMNVRVDYKLFREANTYDDDDVAMEICKNTQSQSRRFICMVHIIHDTTFKKYNYVAKKGMMKLFRGFAFQLIFDGDAYPSPAETIDSLQVSPLAASEAADDLDSRPLMLKMKFLPYMVRTFGCRNGLKTLSQSGVDAYERYTLGMLQKWGISHGAIKKWQPFFYQWGLYAKDVLDKQRARNQDQKKIAHDNQIPPQNTSSAPVDSISPLRHELSARRYLWHLSAFEKSYRQGTMFSQGTSDSTSACLPNCIFRGLILVVSLTKKISAIFSNVLSVELGIQQRCCDLQRIDEASILSSLQEDGRGGIICNVQLDENKKTLLALIKTNNYNEAIHIVLVGCGQSDIDSRYESETKDHKRISGLAKSWKRLKCKYIHDLPNLPKFMDLDDDGNPSQVRICPQVKELVDKLTVASNALPSQDTRPGLLVFFPGIPGCGKSSLCCNSNIQEVLTKRCSKIWDSRNNNLTSIETPFKDRQIVVFEGDKIDGKYWPHILKHRLEQSSSITITDKNSTPNAWDIIKEVSEKSKAVPLPILPDATALSTTIVTSQTNAQSCYPFSLQYLAMCMLRVLTRPAGSHNGKLDSETDNACMIVVKFYCLYRGISAEDMGSLILDRTAFNYTEEDCPIVTVPFFKDNCDLELPSDLRDCLMDALRLQNAINTKTSEVNEDDFVSMETRLRELLLLHQDKLKSMSASIDGSREKFISQIADRVMDIDDIFQLKNAIEGTGLQQFIEIVSIDVDVKKIHDILFRLATHNVDVGNFLHSRGGLQMSQSSDSDTVQREETADMVLKDGSGTFVEKTHVTMSHFSQLSQQKFRDTYGHLDGNLVSVSVTDLIIGETVAALSVVVPDKIYGETPCVIPAPLNAYPHITIWFGKGESAARSNDLPSMVERGEAKRVLLKEPVQVSGKIGYWFI